MKPLSLGVKVGGLWFGTRDSGITHAGVITYLVLGYTIPNATVAPLPPLRALSSSDYRTRSSTGKRCAHGAALIPDVIQRM